MKLKMLEEQHSRKYSKINENLGIEPELRFQDKHNLTENKDKADLISSNVEIKNESEETYNSNEAVDDVSVESEIKFKDETFSEGFKEEIDEEEGAQIKAEAEDENIENGETTNLLRNLNKGSQNLIKKSLSSIITNANWCNEDSNNETVTLTCLKCSLDFTSQTAFNDHQKSHLFKCPECNKFFDRSLSLKIHMAFHGTIKEYKCKLCKKSFTRKSSLKDHSLSHSGEKPYQCDVCKKFYRSKSSLVSHFRYHFKDKIYECPICKKSFFHPSGLSEHLRIHRKAKEYKCNICAKCFGYGSSLKRHIKSHYGADVYQCNECGKCFKQNSSLSFHKRSKHLGIKPYKCEDCDKTFSRAWSLRNHMNIHRIFQIPNTIEIISTNRKIDTNAVR